MSKTDIPRKPKHLASARSLLAAGILGLAPTAPAADYKVYILTGQSNALGTTALEANAYAPGPHDADAVTSLFWSNVTSSNTLYPPSLYGDSGGTITTLQAQQGDNGANPAFWGPEVGFARTLYDLDLKDGTRHDNILIIKATRGGGGNTLWNKDNFDLNNNAGHMWGALRDTVDAGLTQLTGQGHQFNVQGLIYLQGESNSAAEASLASSRLDTLYTNLRSHINDGHSGAADGMRLVIGEIAASQANTARQTTTAQHQQLALDQPAYTFVNTADLPLKSDNIHFGKDAKLEIGRRMGYAMMGLDPDVPGSALAITNPSFEIGDALDAVESNPPPGWQPLGGGMFHANAAAPNQSLNDFGGAYADDTNGLDGQELAFNTKSAGIAGDGLAQTLGAPASDNTVYRLTVGVGDRNFASRFAGLRLELRLADDTVLASQAFDTDDVAPLFTHGGNSAAGQVVDVVANFLFNDIDNNQALRIAIIAGGATHAINGGTQFGQSLDIDHIRLISHAPGDTDADGDIDDSDLGTIFVNYTGPIGLAGGKSFAHGDADGDGDIDDSDIGTALANYTGPIAAPAVPEPGAALFMGAVGLLLLRPTGG